MEKWQVDWITKHLVELQRNTRCTVRLLTALQAKEILDWDEVTELDDEVSTAARVKKFYSILMTKDKGYDVVTEELGSCRQTGAAKVLLNGKAEHGNQMTKGRLQLAVWNDPSHEKRFLRGPEGLNDFLASRDKKVLLISTMDVEVTVNKIEENVDRPVRNAENDRELRELMQEHLFESRELLVLSCGKFLDSSFVRDVVSWSSNGAKAILIFKDHKLKDLETNAAFGISKDNLRWTDLKYRFQEELLDMPVINQIGWEPREIREILEEAGAKYELRDEKILLNLVNGKTPALFRALPDALSYYVHRKIRSRFVLNKKVIFREGTSDIFLVTGIGAVDLSRYLSGCNHSSDNSSSQVRQLSVNYILLEHIDHIDKIYEKAKGKAVHWIHHENGKFLWAKSGNGSMKRIQEATEGMAEENMSSSETEFISLLDKHEEKYGNSPVLIADTPGMGKSTLLQNLARMILKKSGTKIVFFVAFSDLINLLKANTRNPSEISTKTFESVLLQLTTECGPELGKCVLKTLLRSASPVRNKIKMELMLDGYDEIYSDNLPLAKKLLTLIRDSYHSARIWVATRPHLMHDLENDLHVVGFTILPFDESDQENFLIEFWRSEKIKMERSLNCPNIDQDLVKFARHCLENVKQIWATNSDKEDICGVPLQCLLIAKVYLDDCLSFTRRDKLTTNSEPRLSLKVTSIKDLYEALIQKKLEIYSERYAKEFRPEMKTKLLNIHYFFALQLLFPKCAPVFESALIFDGVPITDILNLGIVESGAVELKNNPPSFGHRTISEFLVARFVAEQLSIDEEDASERFTNYEVGNLLFDGVLRTLMPKQVPSMRYYEKFENQVFAFFLDSLLEGLPLDKTRLEGIVAGRISPVKACIYGDHLNLFKALKKGYEKVDTTVFATAVAKTSKLFLQYICSEYNVTLPTCVIDDDAHPDLSITLLHIAVESREFSFVEFLLNCHGFGQLVKDFHPSIQNLLCAVVRHSNKNPEWLIEEKILILRKLVELNRDLLDVTGEYGSNPLVHEEAHVKLILELLELGGNPLVRNGAYCMANWCRKLSGSDFHRVVTTLTVEQAKELLSGKGEDFGWTMLHDIASYLVQPKKETLEYLLKLGANFSIANEDGTCLHQAVFSMNVKLARLLLELGMHAIVNQKDHIGRTPLDHLLMDESNTKYLGELWDLMISYGATFSTDSKEILRKLMTREFYSWKSSRLNPSQGRFLLEHASGAEVNAKDIDLNTPMHICVNTGGRGMFEMVQMLLEKGAELEAKNKNGETPLQILIGKPYFNADEQMTMTLLLSKGAFIGSAEKAQVTFLSIIRGSRLLRYEQFEELANLLVKQGAELRNEEGGGNALLDECTKNGLLTGVKYLLAKGVSVNGYNKGETALHVAVGIKYSFAMNTIVSAKDFGMKTRIVQHMLENGANVNSLDAHGLTPLGRWLKQASPRDLEVFLLFVAKDQELTPLGSEEATRILFQVAQYKEGLGESELLKIAQSKLLTEAKVRELDDKGKSILHYAAELRHTSLLRFFLQKGADVNVRDVQMQTPLYAALFLNSFRKEHVVDTLKELLSAGADTDADDFDCKTIVELSLEYDSSALVVKFVLETGHFDKNINNDDFIYKIVFSIDTVDKYRELVSRFTHVSGRSLQDVGRDSADMKKTSLLHVAVAVGNYAHVAFLLDEKLFVLSPLSAKEQLRFANLLHLCVRYTHVQQSITEIVKRMKIISKLVHHNRDLLNSKDVEGRTPLLMENVHVSLLLALVELGADYNCMDNNGNTVDQLATKYLDKEDYNMFAKLLIRKGYSAFVTNSRVTSEGGAKHSSSNLTSSSNTEL